MDNRQNRKSNSTTASIISLGTLLCLMWLLELCNWLLPQLQLDSYGIRPRDISWLPGIIIAPLLHGSWAHLIANTPPLIIFGGLVSLQGLRIFCPVTIVFTAGLFGAYYHLTLMYLGKRICLDLLEGC